MIAAKINIPEDQLKQEQLKGARLSIYFRWALILVLSILLSIQHTVGYHDISSHAVIFIIAYSFTNLILWFAIKKDYNPRYLSFVSALIDTGFICYHIYGMAAYFDPRAATAAATIFLIPAIFLIYTFRLDRGLMYFLIAISVTGFNYVFFTQYFQSPEFFSESISLSPMSHIFKTVYIAFIGFLCIYMQTSIFKFIRKQLVLAIEKSKIDTEFQVEQEKNRYANQLIEKEKALNKKLENEIHKKDKIANQLKENKELLKSIISNLLGFTYRCMPDNKYTMLFISDQIEDISGYKPEDFIDNKILSYITLIHPDDLEYVRKKIPEAIANKKQFELEYRLKHKNGDLVWVHEAGQGVYDADGNVLYIDGIITDISVKKYTEIELKETQALINTLISNLVSAVSRCLYDESFTVKFYSEKIYDITGYYATDFIDNKKIKFVDIIHNEDLEMLIEHIDYAIKNKTSYSIEFRIIHRNGNIVWVHENGQPIFDENDKVIYLDGITTDITDKKNAEQSLILAKLELEQLNAKLEETVKERTKELTEVNTKLVKLQKENLQSQFDVLKQQVNPHFLFNSLNVLTSLIKIDPDLAESFTEKLSKVYRYVLENKEKDIVSLNTELDFMTAYLFLLDIRFMGKILIKINIDKSKKDLMILPMALQLLIENAIKHNTFSKTNPLSINVKVDKNDYLVVSNNKQIRETQIQSTGVGLLNIQNRYELISNKKPFFDNTKDEFVAKIPLVDESELLMKNNNQRKKRKLQKD